MSPTNAFRVAFVCTANRFRSPLAAAIFRDAAAALVPHVDVESYGTLDLAEGPPLTEVVELGRRFGVHLADHRSRCIRQGCLRDADLVVGFERFHLASAVLEGQARREVTYTLPQIVRVLEQSFRPEVSEPIERARKALVDLARAGVEERFEEVADPIGQPLKTQRAIAEQVVELTRRLVAGLFGGDGGAGHP